MKGILKTYHHQFPLFLGILTTATIIGQEEPPVPPSPPPPAAETVGFPFQPNLGAQGIAAIRTGGNAPWYISSPTSFQRIPRSGTIPHNGQSWIEVDTEYMEPGRNYILSFRWFVDSEVNRDGLVVAWKPILDPIANYAPLDSISGHVPPFGMGIPAPEDQNAQYMAYEIPAGMGAVSFRWSYLKDPTISVSADAGYVCDVMFRPTPNAFEKSDAGMKLHITSGRYGYQIYWPIPTSGTWTLQASPQVSPTSWQAAGLAVNTDGTWNYVYIGVPAFQQYNFRLKKN